MDTPTIYFYNDSNIVGGHEILTARIINHLSDALGVKIHFSFNCEDIHHHLSNSVITSSLPFHSKTKSIVHNNKTDFQLVAQHVRSLKPDLAIISQGYIESGVRGLIGCKMAGINTGSYIPFGNTNRELGNKFATVRDVISKPIFAMNNFYVTISKYQAKMLQRLTSKDIHIVNNPVSHTSIKAQKPCPITTPTVDTPLEIAVIGRILFKQKNQDSLPLVSQALKRMGINVNFHIVGDGPDKDKLIELIRCTNTEEQFTFHNWLNKTELSNLLSSTIDAVIIPSHYEGLPLVLLESIYQGKPTLISNMPFIEDYSIPSNLIFNPNHTQSIVDSIVSLTHSNPMNDVLKLQKEVETTNSFERFSQDIEETFSTLLTGSTEALTSHSL